MKALPQAIAGAELPQRDHRGEVERRDAGDDAERLAHRIDVDAGAGAVGIFALHQMRRAEAEFEHLDAALNVALGVGDRLAVLAGENVGEFVGVLDDQLVEFHQHAGAALRIGRRPGRLRRLGVLDRGAHLGGRGERDRAAHRAVHRLKNFGRAARCARDVLAADEMPVLDHGSLPGIDFVVGALMPHAFAHSNRRFRASDVRKCAKHAEWTGTMSGSSSRSRAPGNSSRAHGGWGLDHATASRRVAALEAELGAKLFDRRTTGARLTSAGERFLLAAEQMESAFLHAQAEVSDVDVELSGDVRIGAPDGFSTYYLAGIIARIRREAPRRSRPTRAAAATDAAGAARARYRRRARQAGSGPLRRAQADRLFARRLRQRGLSRERGAPAKSAISAATG